MTNRRLVILGGGEHARVVADAARSRVDAWELVGYTTADRVEPDEGIPGVAWLGDDAAASTWIAGLDPAERPSLVLGFWATAEFRKAVVERFPDAAWATLVHAAAWVSPSAATDAGAVVLAGAVVNAGAHLGGHAIVNSGAIVEHDVTVGDFAHVAPGVKIGGGALIGEAALLGLGAVIRDHITVGPAATVGMGAVVIADVPPGAVVVGNPAVAREPERPDG